MGVQLTVEYHLKTCKFPIFDKSYDDFFSHSLIQIFIQLLLHARFNLAYL